MTSTWPQPGGGGNAGDALTIPANGAFTFANALAAGASYQVAATAQPTNPFQTCSVAGGAGTVGGSDVTSVAITCTINSFTVGGIATGVSGSGLVLQNNGAGNLAVSAVSSAIALTQGTAPVTFNPRFAYTANFTSGDVSAYAVNATTG